MATAGQTQTFPVCGGCGWFIPGTGQDTNFCAACGGDLVRFWLESDDPPLDLTELIKLPPTIFGVEEVEPYAWAVDEIVAGLWAYSWADGFDGVDLPIIYTIEFGAGAFTDTYYAVWRQDGVRGVIVPSLLDFDDSYVYQAMQLRCRKHIVEQFQWVTDPAFNEWESARAMQAGDRIVYGFRQDPGDLPVIELREVAGDVLVESWTMRREQTQGTTPVVSAPPVAGTAVYIRVGDGTNFQQLPNFVWDTDWLASDVGDWSVQFDTPIWGEVAEMMQTGTVDVLALEQLGNWNGRLRTYSSPPIDDFVDQPVLQFETHASEVPDLSDPATTRQAGQPLIWSPESGSWSNQVTQHSMDHQRLYRREFVWYELPEKIGVVTHVRAVHHKDLRLQGAAWADQEPWFVTLQVKTEGNTFLQFVNFHVVRQSDNAIVVEGADQLVSTYENIACQLLLTSGIRTVLPGDPVRFQLTDVGANSTFEFGDFIWANDAQDAWDLQNSINVDRYEMFDFNPQTLPREPQ